MYSYRVKTNHFTIAHAFFNSLSLLWPDGIQHRIILLFVADTASYTQMATEGLKVLFPKMMLIIRVVHGAHHVCEKMRKLFAETH